MDDVGEAVVGTSVFTTVIVGLLVGAAMGGWVGFDVGALVPMRDFGRHIK
jgi:hypothetical protein